MFTDVPYTGNPVAVVLDSEGLDTRTMKRFARWTNLSETTFVLPPEDSAADYRLRIFTPAGELPFAGHPTLGSAHAWLAAGGVARDTNMLVQECGAGLVRVQRSDTEMAFAAPPLRRSGPVDPELVTHLSEVLDLDPNDIVDTQWVDNGPGWVGVLLDSAESVLALRTRDLDLDVGVVGPYPPGAPEAFEVRAFFPVDGRTVEDPVTGSLNASLAGWLLEAGRATTPYVARQGTALGRLGRIHVRRDPDGTLWTGGGTVTCIQGHAEL